jgi:hypothetical protein
LNMTLERKHCPKTWMMDGNANQQGYVGDSEYSTAPNDQENIQ